jgi:hypothetical protein
MKNSKYFGAHIVCKSINTYQSGKAFTKEFWRDFEHTLYAECTLSVTLKSSCDKRKGGNNEFSQILRYRYIS